MQLLLNRLTVNLRWQLAHLLRRHGLVVINWEVLAFGSWILLPRERHRWVFLIFDKLAFEVAPPARGEIILFAVQVLQSLLANLLQVHLGQLILAAQLNCPLHEFLEVVLQGLQIVVITHIVQLKESVDGQNLIFVLETEILLLLLSFLLHFFIFDHRHVHTL